MSIEPGALYVVATPIGNLGDLSPRAAEVLGAVAVVAAEDTRRTGALLRHAGLDAACIAFHEHNERRMVETLLERLAAGEAVALVSDAGTPLLSDPGFHLVRAARERGVRVVPVPGPSAAVAALSVSGLATDRFCFEGFPPAKAAARRRRLAALRGEVRTLLFFEAPHRVAETLADLAEALGPERQAVLARELTKTFETVLDGTLAELAERVAADPDQQRGEIVLVVAGAPAEEAEAVREAEALAVAERLARELPPSRAAAVAAEITGAKKNRLYRHLMGRTQERGD